MCNENNRKGISLYSLEVLLLWLIFSSVYLTFFFFDLCLKLHPKLSVPKKITKPKTIHKQIWSRVWEAKPNNQTCIVLPSFYAWFSVPLLLVLSTVKSCLNSVDQWKLHVKIQHWLYCISKSKINTDMRDYWQQQTSKDLFRVCILIWCYLCNVPLAFFGSRETWMSWASF